LGVLLSYWVKIMLCTENQRPRLPGSALKVPGVWVVVGSYPLLSHAPTPVEVDLGCDNIGLYGSEEEIGSTSKEEFKSIVKQKSSE
jgi:hypothetical protein